MCSFILLLKVIKLVLAVISLGIESYKCGPAYSKDSRNFSIRGFGTCNINWFEVLVQYELYVET